MTGISKIPLAKRLQKAAAKGNEPEFLHIFRFYTDTYFFSLDLLFGGTSYRDTMSVVLSPYLEEYERTPLLAQFVADSRMLTEAEQTQILYQTLIRPFAELEKEKVRNDIECLHLPF